MEKGISFFDCHVDTLTEITGEGERLIENKYNLDLNRISAFADHYTQVFAIWKDRAEMGKCPEKEFMCLYQRALDLLDVERERIAFCRNGCDMRKAHEQGKAAAFLSIEDLSIMGDLVGKIKELGFTFAMLTWNYENTYGAGAAVSQKRALTLRGKEVVRELLNQDIVIDISHLSDCGAEDIFKMTEKAVIASHSNVRDLCGHPRNLTREHISEIIRRNGLIGMNFYDLFVRDGGESRLVDLFRHMDYILNLGGQNVLVLGSDFDGCHNRFPKGITGVESIPYLWKEMRKAGFEEKLCRNIIFENGYRFMEKI